MNTRKRTLATTGIWSLIAASALVVGGGLAQAQGQTTATMAGEGQKSKPMHSMMADQAQAGAMMAQHQQMVAGMKALDLKLDDLVTRMNAARGTEKTDAVADVVNELVALRKQMREQMMTTQGGMRDHMMEFMSSMQAGTMGTMNHGQANAAQSTENCPMMKKLPQEAADHAAHHPKDK